MPILPRLSPWVCLLLAVLAVLALARGLGLVLHRPLLAVANNYDQVRYTACFDLAPWRPGVPPDRGNPQAPLSRFAFHPLPADACLATSDVFFTVPVIAAWRAAEALGGRAIHSVRRLGEWRLLLWFGVAAWATAQLLRARRADLAAALLAGFGLLALDPANTLYLHTFYAEAAAVGGLWFAAAGALAAAARPTRAALVLVALGAALLGGSKLQHLVLPALLGLAVLAGAGRRQRAIGLALLAGAVLGLAVHAIDVVRAPTMARDMSRINRADFALLVLLPESSDRARVADALDLQPSCAAWIGHSVYHMTAPLERTCPNIDDWSHARLWWLLASDPPAVARALAHLPRGLLPWLPTLGVVEGADNAALPAGQPSLGHLLEASPLRATGLLLLPWFVLGGCLVLRGRPGARGFALACATGSAAVGLIALFGDGDVELARHAQLAPDFALASLGVPLAWLLRRAIPPAMAQADTASPRAT